MNKVQEAARLLNKPVADVIREAMELGLADWAITGYSTPEIVAREAIEKRKATQNSDIAMVSEKGGGYKAPKKGAGGNPTGNIQARNAAAPLPTFLVKRKAYILEPRAPEANQKS